MSKENNNEQQPENIIPCLGRFVSGKTLRREYIYKERMKYLLDNQFDDKHPEKEMMEKWANEARQKYVNEGDYEVRNNIATYVGKY